MQRRKLLKLAALSGAAGVLRQPTMKLPIADQPRETRIIDGHIHLFDPSRPGGVPWPEKSDIIYKSALPERYASIASPFGIEGAIAVEASPLATDNDWLLRVAANHPIVVGVVGDLIPSAPTYLADIERLHANPLFLGIRYGNLWNRNLLADQQKPGFIDGLKVLSQMGLVLESANPDPELIQALVHVADRIPELRIVIDHLPHGARAVEMHTRGEYWSNLHHLAQNTNIFVKLSEIPVILNGNLQTDVSYYRDTLDTIWHTFGENRIFYGSDWPNSDHVASFADTFKIVHAYVTPMGPTVGEKFFWKNSITAYQWKKRTPEQPSL